MAAEGGPVAALASEPGKQDAVTVPPCPSLFVQHVLVYTALFPAWLTKSSGGCELQGPGRGAGRAGAWQVVPGRGGGRGSASRQHLGCRGGPACSPDAV